MNFLNYDGAETHPTIPYRNNYKGNFFNNNQSMNLGLEFNAFKDSPLKNISNIFNLMIGRVEKQYQMDLIIFFKNIIDLHTECLARGAQLEQLNHQNVNIQSTVTESDNNPQIENFRDYLLFHSSNRETREVLFKIEQYTDQKVRDYLQLKSKVLTKSEWAQFVAELTGERESIVSTHNCAAIKKYVLNQCKENPAIRSGDVDEVIYNIKRLRSLQ